jgi:L-iditol 2-dehydrogenase
LRAAILHGPGDLRVEDVPTPRPAAGEVLVRVEAATTCGTDVKMWRRGHAKLLPAYPALFGHEMAGVRDDTGERVFVNDSVACGACAACRAGRSQICRDPAWIVGGFAEYLVAPEAALHPVPGGLDLAGAAMAEPLAAAVHAVARAPERGRAAVLGGGPMGQMIAAVLVAEGREVTVVDRHAERRAQAERLGARAAAARTPQPDGAVERRGPPDRHDGAHLFDVVFEAVGRPEAWRDAVEAAAPGGVVVFVGGCAQGTDVALPAHPIHYEELDLRGAFHHSRAEVDRALELLAGGVDWRTWASEPIRLEDLAEALASSGGPARKWLVRPAT